MALSTSDMVLIAFIAIIQLFIIGHKNVDALANCPNRCDCDEDTLVVVCGEGELDVLPIALNPSIKRLVIQKNKIKTIDSSIQFYAELSFLDLSYNHLLVIPGKTFFYQKKLQELHLNHNKMGSISNQTFLGLNTLTSLNLRENFFIELGANVFSAMPKLEELNLGKNRIATIDPNAFRGLDNLRVLYLNDNTLTSVPSDAFTTLTSLAELYLGINSFTTIENGAFEKLHGLSLLDLNGAALVNISTETFHGLEGSLRQLDLTDNRLQYIPTTALSKLTRLEDLSLGQNEFETIPEGAFAGLTNLRHLDITGSLKLRSIQSNALATNTNLEKLTLVSNKALSDIETGAFSGLPHLKHCNFRDNALAVISENMLKWNELETFDFAENPLICDCRILWLRTLLNSKNASQTMQENVLCASPDTLHDEPLKLLSSDAIGCSHDDSRQQAMIGILLVGSAALITALALILYRCRRKLREAVKGRWGNTALGHKEREYQKTFSDEEYMQANARHPSHPPGSLSVHQQTTTLSNYPQHPHHYHHPGLRPIPVTEL